jgi:spore photoproduct lyase
MDLEKYNFTFSQKNILKNILIDIKMWKEKNISSDILESLEAKYSNKQLANKIFQEVVKHHTNLKQTPNNYKDFKNTKHKAKKFSFVDIDKNSLSLGDCPVASENTRCCNLMTLDAVESCGFDCSYCSIQSFYNQDKIGFDKNFKKKLQNLKLNPNKTYHIGTGQSSDSLLWGNKHGILDSLFEFAFSNPNVILEFKTKSDNIKYFLENKVPNNIIVTWSLQTPIIIKNEEHLTASLEQRIQSAKLLSQKGILVGFHFHPIVQYENYLQDYGKIYQTLQATFKPSQVALISFGTLTFIKPVVKKLRNRQMPSKILQMPFETINNKQSYPLDIKKQMFKFSYDSFKSWHKKVYFYLCMEEHSLWKDVFGYEYSSNDMFEDFMLKHYSHKIKQNID